VSDGKILVLRGGAIGDFILTLPVFAALREQFPKARLEVLGYPHVATLAHAGGLVDGFHAIEARALASFFARNGTLDPALQEFFAGFSIIISYLYDPDEILRENVGRCSKAQFIAGPYRPDDRGGVHATDVLLKPLERLAIFAPDSIPRLKVQRHVSRGESRFWLAVHPGSGSESKNWPEENWSAAMIQWLAIPRISFLLIGGEAERGKVERLAARLPNDRLEVAHHLPLLDLATRLGSCDAFVGHDSGISHLAAALGLPVVALWGETPKVVWRPKGERVILIQHQRGLQALPAGQVVEIIAKLTRGSINDISTYQDILI
jgi:ADP-heptose:LPS heptosyltransferase